MVTWRSSDPERSRSWLHYIWCPLSRKRLEIQTLWQWSTYMKWLPGNQMVTWPMTSLKRKRSRTWPQYAYSPLYRKWLEIQTSLQWSTYRKLGMASQMVTWTMTSRDLEKSSSWPHYVWCPLYRKRLEIHIWWQWSTYTIRYDTIAEFNGDSKAEYSALSSTRRQKKRN